ncbi:MAG: serine/threonine-protein kinase, partial [Syntrophobacteraceae bacterium]
MLGFILCAGEILQDRYQVQKVLGKGGFGATYLVEDLKLKGKRRALKEIPEPLFDEQEVRLLSQLNHPNLPDIIDRFISNGMVYLVLEFGGRHTLASECKRLGKRIPLSRLVPLMSQLCDALAYLHSQKPPIIHRDLKPDNVLLDDQERITLIDFGIAKQSNPNVT